MIWLNPERVVLGAFELRNVLAVTLDRSARRTAEEWTDLGPYEAFADVPEQRIGVSISRLILESETTGPRPGELLALSFRSSAGASAAAVRQVNMNVVVISVEHSMSKSGRASQTLRAVALSSDGAADPVNETAVEGEL